MRTTTLLLTLAPLAAFAQSFTPPDDLNFRTANIMSEGTRMAAEVYTPKSVGTAKLPVVIMCHGWGGAASGLRREAIDISRAGYLVVVFDYRGWGASDSRLILTGPAPKEKRNNRFTAEVLEVREVVDPLDMARDLLNAIHWVHGEPQADTARIGLWGSSYSGGHVVWAAARDHRIKALVSQVGGMDSRPLAVSLDANAVATKRTRGEIGYPAPRVQQVGKLFGGPIVEKMIDYAPVEDAARVSPQCAQLYIIAANEELFDNRDNAIKAHSLAKGPKKLVSIPGITHYGVYQQARQQATTLAIEWFNQYLKESK